MLKPNFHPPPNGQHGHSNNQPNNNLPSGHPNGPPIIHMVHHGPSSFGPQLMGTGFRQEFGIGFPHQPAVAMGNQRASQILLTPIELQIPVGIGIHLDKLGDSFVVSSLSEGGSAKRSGMLKVGSTLVSLSLVGWPVTVAGLTLLCVPTWSSNLIIGVEATPVGPDCPRTVRPPGPLPGLPDGCHSDSHHQPEPSLVHCILISRAGLRVSLDDVIVVGSWCQWPRWWAMPPQAVGIVPGGQRDHDCRCGPGVTVAGPAVWLLTGRLAGAGPGPLALARPRALVLPAAQGVSAAACVQCSRLLTQQWPLPGGLQVQVDCSKTTGMSLTGPGVPSPPTIMLRTCWSSRPDTGNSSTATRMLPTLSPSFLALPPSLRLDTTTLSLSRWQPACAIMILCSGHGGASLTWSFSTQTLLRLQSKINQYELANNLHV